MRCTLGRLSPSSAVVSPNERGLPSARGESATRTERGAADVDRGTALRTVGEAEGGIGSLAEVQDGVWMLVAEERHPGAGLVVAVRQMLDDGHRLRVNGLANGDVRMHANRLATRVGAGARHRRPV